MVLAFLPQNKRLWVLSGTFPVGRATHVHRSCPAAARPHPPCKQLPPWAAIPQGSENGDYRPSLHGSQEHLCSQKGSHERAVGFYGRQPSITTRSSAHSRTNDADGAGGTVETTMTRTLPSRGPTAVSQNSPQDFSGPRRGLGLPCRCPRTSGPGRGGQGFLAWMSFYFA